jgi:hypothetical protein
VAQAGSMAKAAAQLALSEPARADSRSHTSLDWPMPPRRGEKRIVSGLKC